MAELIVEDQTGLSNANVYVSKEEYIEFAQLNGYDELDENDLAIYLVRATNFIDSLETSFVGKRLNPDQALAFPRIDPNFSCEVSHLYSMKNLKKAVMFAVVAQSEGLSLLPTTLSKDDFVSKEKIENAIEVQYSDRYFTSDLVQRFPMIERYLKEYMVSIGANVKVGR